MRWAAPTKRASLRAVIAYACALLAALATSPFSDAAAAGAGGVPELDGYRTDDYRAPVPLTLKGARAIDADGAEEIIEQGQAIFIDVYPRANKPPNLPPGTIWRDPTHMTIEGAHWLPNVGYGVLSDEFESYFRTRLAALTGNDPTRTVVFFCQRDCWMSWNAAKRALEWGYTDVVWFSEGTDAWQEAGFDLVKASPVP